MNIERMFTLLREFKGKVKAMYFGAALAWTTMSYAKEKDIV